MAVIERRGDLYVRLRVQIPTRLAAAERKLWEQLRALGKKGTPGSGPE